MKKVLIVDDSAYMRLFIKKIIIKAGISTIYEASNRADALEMFKSVQPEIITLDLNMCEFLFDGMELLTDLMKIDPSAVIIIISAVGHENMKNQCLELGAKHFINKPLDTKVLLGVLETYK